MVPVGFITPALALLFILLEPDFITGSSFSLKSIASAWFHQSGSNVDFDTVFPYVSSSSIPYPLSTILVFLLIIVYFVIFNFFYYSSLSMSLFDGYPLLMYVCSVPAGTVIAFLGFIPHIIFQLGMLVVQFRLIVSRLLQPLKQ